MLSKESSIIIQRHNSWADRMRNYKVIIDDKVIGNVSAGQSIEFQIDSGHHKILLKIDWCRSNILEFNIKPGEVARFECGNSATGWRLILILGYVIFLRNKYLWLNQINN